MVARENSILATFGITTVTTQLWVLALLTLLLWGLESLFEYFYSVMWRRLAQNVEHDLRSDTYAHVQNLEIAYF